MGKFLFSGKFLPEEFCCPCQKFLSFHNLWFIIFYQLVMFREISLLVFPCSLLHLLLLQSCFIQGCLHHLHEHLLHGPACWALYVAISNSCSFGFLSLWPHCWPPLLEASKTPTENTLPADGHQDNNGGTHHHSDQELAANGWPSGFSWVIIPLIHSNKTNVKSTLSWLHLVLLPSQASSSYALVDHLLILLVVGAWVPWWWRPLSSPIWSLQNTAQVMLSHVHFIMYNTHTLIITHNVFSVLQDTLCVSTVPTCKQQWTSSVCVTVPLSHSPHPSRPLSVHRARW